jgi:very-short-patch-repair endonuclease
MGWKDLMLTVEYDGDLHRTSRTQYVKDAERLEYLAQAGWTHLKVLAEHRGSDVIRRVRRAWDLLAHRG